MDKGFLSIEVDEKLVWLFPFAIAVALLFFGLGTIPGLVRDEALFGLIGIDILDGARPLSGYFNEYTSPLYYYLVAATFSVFGDSVLSLRLSGVLFNILAVLAYVDVIRRTSPRVALYSFWFLVTLPAFVIWARMAQENFALNPFFLFGGIWCFAVLGSSEQKWKSFAGYSLAGLSFGLGVWNHIITAPTVISVVLLYLFWQRPGKTQLKKILPAFLLGGFIAAMPKLYLILWQGHLWLPASIRTGLAPLAPMVLNLVYTFGGDGLFIRRSGEVVFSLNWFLPFGFVAAMAYVFLGKVAPEYKRYWLIGASCLLLSFIGTWLIGPEKFFGSRYWLLPLWFSAIPLASAVAAIENPRTRILVASIIIGVNLVAIGTNFFYAFSKTGGIPKDKVYVGGRYDNSRDFVRMQPLIKRMVAYNDMPFYVEDIENWRAKFLAPASARDRVGKIEDAFVPGVKVEPGTLFAFYRKQDRVYAPFLRLETVLTAIRPQLSTSSYVVYEAVKQ